MKFVVAAVLLTATVSVHAAGETARFDSAAGAFQSGLDVELTHAETELLLTPVRAQTLAEPRAEAMPGSQDQGLTAGQGPADGNSGAPVGVSAAPACAAPAAEKEATLPAPRQATVVIESVAGNVVLIATTSLRTR